TRVRDRRLEPGLNLVVFTISSLPLLLFVLQLNLPSFCIAV
ncbi:hypothetical protein A2U01_0101716, partial [Trifolium medium]|nr:hypothetical protein [Trifolium medium]